MASFEDGPVPTLGLVLVGEPRTGWPTAVAAILVRLLRADGFEASWGLHEILRKSYDDSGGTLPGKCDYPSPCATCAAGDDLDVPFTDRDGIRAMQELERAWRGPNVWPPAIRIAGGAGPAFQVEDNPLREDQLEDWMRDQVNELMARLGREPGGPARWRKVIHKCWARMIKSRQKWENKQWIGRHHDWSGGGSSWGGGPSSGPSGPSWSDAGRSSSDGGGGRAAPPPQDQEERF